MSSTKARFSHIGGALLAICVVLATAIHLTQRERTGEFTAAATDTGLRTHSLPTPPGLVPMAGLLEARQMNVSGRQLVIAHAVVPHPASAERIRSELATLAETVKRDYPQADAIRILGYTSAADHAASDENAAWRLTWSPDGRGWDGDLVSQFEMDIQPSAR